MNRYSGAGSLFPPALKNIILANLTVFIFQLSPFGDIIIKQFAVSYNGVFEQGKVWQLFTYMFLHGDLGHIFWNMVFIWMLGKDLEWEWGSKKFLNFYFITGIGAGLINILISDPRIPTVGASGALYGIFAGMLVLWPNRTILINFVFPVKIKYFIGFYIFMNVFGLFGNSGNIAVAAHLGGFVVGFIYLRFWFLYYKVKSLVSANIANPLKKSNPSMSYHKGGSDDSKVDYYRKKIDELLDKINKVGYLNLTDDEKKMLDEGSRYLREHDQNNFN